MYPSPRPARRLRSSLLKTLTVGLLALVTASDVASAQANPEIYIRVLNANTSVPDDLIEVALDDASPPPRGRLPVLFVHGHNLLFGDDSNRNYRVNWQDELNGLPSFMMALDLPANREALGIEDYYIRFQDQHRSIADDAADIAAAVERIRRRHDPRYDERPTSVQVVIIAFSKGTLSTRLYLKNVDDENRRTGRSFRPVSEFIAIAPPNHGISSGIGAADSCALQQMMDAVGEDCTALTPPQNCSPSPADFFQTLNGHPITDTQVLDATDSYPTEAPGSRANMDEGEVTPNPPTEGTLYVTLYAADDRDQIVGGGSDSDDCRGRRIAKNLSPHAINIPVDVPAFLPAAVHPRTVHTREVICKALYAAVHHRSPEGQTCSPDDGDVPVIPPPPRAAAVLALDFSGSMSLPACPGCADTRADVLKESVELFVYLWQVVSAPNDRLGVTYFRSDVVGGETLLPVGVSADDIVAEVRGQQTGGGTAMGGGLQRALRTLGATTDSPIRRVILFTDGMQNLNPMVQRADGRLVIDNQTGRQNSNIPPATPTPLPLSPGIAVDTIGVGAGEAFVGLLDEIADETRGHAWVTAAPDEDLRRFFVEELINALRGFSPQLVAYRRGAVAPKGGAESFDVEEGVRKLVLKVSWKRGDALDFSVAKDGVDVTSAGRFVAGEFYKIFVIDLPAGGRINSRGNWQLRVKGRAGAAYEAAAIVDGGRIEYDATFDAKRPRAGDPLDLVVRLTDGGRPVGGARVTVTLTSPTVSPGDRLAAARPKELPAPEPGLTVAERRLLALSKAPGSRPAHKPRRETLLLKPSDKGEFRARLSPQIPGVHTASVVIEGDDARLGRFSRAVTATVVVRFAAAPLRPRDIFASECDVGGRRYVRLILWPRDARGRSIGPGSSSAISARLSAGRTVGGVQDLGDGSYMLVLQFAPGDDPALTLEADGAALYSGRLSQLPGK